MIATVLSLIALVLVGMWITLSDLRDVLEEKEGKTMTTEDKELLKNILFQKKGITYDDYKCKNDPYVGLSFYELIKCLEEYDKERSNR